MLCVVGKPKTTTTMMRSVKSNLLAVVRTTTSRSTRSTRTTKLTRFCLATQRQRIPTTATNSRQTIRTKTTSSNNNSTFQLETLSAFCIGTLAGALGSLAGMGGGFVMIPLMTSPLLRLSQHQAHGTSLFAVAATGISGAAAYKDFVQLDTALAVAIPAMLTARLGAKATAVLSERYLKRALGLLLLIMGPAVPLKAHLVSNMQQNETTTTKDTKSTDTHNSFHHLIPAALIGVFSGFLSGIFGVGGGTIVVPALAIFSSNEITSHHAALGTSLAAMTLPAAVGTYTHWTVGNLVLRSAIAPALAMGALFGANVGGTYAIHLPESKLQWGFSSLLTVLGIRTLLRA